MNIKTFETVLPVFTGFYGTIWEDCLYSSQLEREIENLEEGEEKASLEMELEGIDCEKDMEETAKRIFDAFVSCDEFKKVFIKGWEFQKLNSQKFYNFSNDQIYCKVTVDMDGMGKWYEEERKSKDFAKFLNENFTSYDGFFSNFSNDPESEDWQEINEKNMHFILDYLYRDTEGEETSEMVLYYNVN